MVNIVDEALSSLHGYGDLAIHGNDITDDIANAITDTSIVRTIDGAPTFALTLNDPKRKIQNSGVFGRRTTVKVGAFTHEVAQTSKSGPEFTVTCEDQVVAELREHDSPLKVAKGAMTHVQFARMMVGEVRWIKFVTDPMAKVVRSKEDLVLGDPTKKGKAALESTWDALTDLASARGWRACVIGVDQLVYVPDSYFFDNDPLYVISEDSEGVDAIDYDYDKGKKVATATITCRSGNWKIPPGVTVRFKEMGPASGKWIVQDITKTLTSLSSTITAIQPQPVLPEPTDSSGSGSSSASGDGTPVISSNPATAVAQYAIAAGFKGADLVTAVAVSFTEDPSHDPTRDSGRNFDGSIDRGLWQINSKAHSEYSDAFCHSGANNARAAFIISSSGKNWEPWTTYRDGAYRGNLDAARKAIAAATKANSQSGNATVGTGSGGVAPKRTTTSLAVDFVNEALSQRGKAYVYGAQTAPSNNDPKSFDCSLLVEWAAGRVGIVLPRTAQEQYETALKHGSTISVAKAIRTRGAVLYEGSPAYHTVISLGNGETIEARGKAYGVNEFGTAGRPFSHGALIPGMVY
jgi:cell wall-associated NlpC family hydrolase